MMSSSTSFVLNMFINGLEEILGNHLEKIVLYGSYARGDYESNSDIDVMILTNLEDDEIEEYRARVCDLAYDMEIENDVILSPLIKNINKYQSRVEVIPFYTNIHREGVVLYG